MSNTEKENSAEMVEEPLWQRNTPELKRESDRLNTGKFLESIGKKIKSVKFSSDLHGVDTLFFTFEDLSTLTISDQGQDCCEQRYMSTDDNLEYFAGAVFFGGDINATKQAYDDWGECIDAQFLTIKTDKGSFTVANYNEHNGYYGGFNVISF